MDRRKKRTSTNQYMMYIELMEKDHIFATGRVPRDMDANYMQKKWKTLSDKLNTCSSGPRLTTEEWRKRLNDWKNTTRCKYRRSISGEKDISMTSLELKALELFGKVPHLSSSSEQLTIHLKSEKDDCDDMEHQVASEAFRNELQAAVDEAIGADGDEDEEMLDDNDENDGEMLGQLEQTQSGGGTAVVTSGGGGGGNSGTTYRTIVVENAAYADDEHNDDPLEFITHKRTQTTHQAATVATAVQTMVTTSTPTATMTKLINGDIPLKRLRRQTRDQIVYEVKNAPIVQPQRTNYSTSASSVPPMTILHTKTQSVSSPQQLNTLQLVSQAVTSDDAREIAHQLKRIADIKADKLNFEISRFKFKNPGFQYDQNTLL